MTIVAALFDWVANEGFARFFSGVGEDYASAHEFRQRHQLRLLAAIAQKS
jgi:hypothetical protein